VSLFNKKKIPKCECECCKKARLRNKVFWYSLLSCAWLCIMLLLARIFGMFLAGLQLVLTEQNFLLYLSLVITAIMWVYANRCLRYFAKYLYYATTYFKKFRKKKAIK
jgi:hypothetical protein